VAAAVAVVVALGVVGMPRPADAAEGDFRISDPRITESSGLALSHLHAHTVWTANDSGDIARIFAVDTRTGRTTGVHTFHAPVTDVEALAITPQGRVLVADIGDNTASRDLVRVYWFDEPALGSTAGSWASWELAYPDGPHDAESIAVNPRTGRVYVITKGSSGAIYALPANPVRRGINRLVRVAGAPAVATDAVFLADGSALAVRTYTALVVLDAQTWQARSTQLLPLQPQGETLSLAPDSGLLAGSEGRRSLVQRVRPTPAPPPTGPSPSPATTSPTPATVPTTGARSDASSDTPTSKAPVQAHGAQLLSGPAASAGLKALPVALLIALLVALALLGARLLHRRTRR
jgi:hypothetical protein